ncbi:MAG: chemotaxis protein CheB, partial [Betaproteobacteria bacterium]
MSEPPASPPNSTFPIVGIGASAGGLAAFEAFFSGLPVDHDPGMAFILVQHLAPDYHSMLAELVQRFTRMPVFEVADGMVVNINCVYIIPPNRDLAFFGGALQLLEPAAPRGQRLPIDFFLRSLAQDQHERAIGIVLSGTGSDGTQGVRAIKGEGGMVIVQSPESTEFDGMPRSAIGTGLVDYQLPPAEMPAQLMAYTAYAFGKPRMPSTVPSPAAENTLNKIFVLLRAQVGHDFSQYKPSTIKRRIERRMAVHQVGTQDAYLQLLQQSRAEIEALFRDLLIGVTSFFRDPEAFKVLEEQVIPQLFVSKPSIGGVIRVWCAGCSTGEEAYSLAILLQECMETLKQSYTVQVFATDIDSRAIATARAGIYPAGIAADISPERLARFFTAAPDGSAYRIHKGIRDMLVFSEQDVIKDPPFSRLDLISCRNLMIYLGAALQKKLIPLFHFALIPRGILFLGTSEGVGEFADLFSSLERKAKIFQRQEALQPMARAHAMRFTSPMSAVKAAMPQPPGKAVFPVKLPLRELTEQALLQHIATAAALVDVDGNILYLHGRSGLYLEPASGEAGINNILKMAREGLQQPLSMALHKAAAGHETVRVDGLNVRTNGHFSRVNLSVCPVKSGLPGVSVAALYLVVLDEAPAQGPAGVTPAALPEAAGAVDCSVLEVRLTMLQRELRDKDEYLQSIREELESANEELKSSNEEMQSVNEELQSTNEELETSKEELQSVNEELSTVNAELQSKVVDLSRSNSDMNNLLAGTGIGTVFVDHHLRILRFTPAVSQVINLILSDVGRPVAHISSNLPGYTTLVADIQVVLDTLIPKALEVQTVAGQWYAMRIQPYRTLDNVIEGAVISFVDITETVLTRLALRQANDLARLAVVLRDAQDAITVQDLAGRMLAWNPGAERLYGWSEAEALQMNVGERIPPELRESALTRLVQLGQAEVLEPYATRRLCKDGSVVSVMVVSSALVDEAGHLYAIATTERGGGGGEGFRKKGGGGARGVPQPPPFRGGPNCPGPRKRLSGKGGPSPGGLSQTGPRNLRGEGAQIAAGTKQNGK